MPGIARLVVALALALGACAGPGTSASKNSTTPVEPVTITGARLAVDVQQPPYKLTLPAALDKPGNVVWGRFKICADPSGQVSGVSVIESADRQVDEQWMEIIRTWRFHPHDQDGVAVPFCQNTRLEVKASGNN